MRSNLFPFTSRFTTNHWRNHRLSRRTAGKSSEILEFQPRDNKYPHEGCKYRSIRKIFRCFPIFVPMENFPTCPDIRGTIQVLLSMNRQKTHGAKYRTAIITSDPPPSLVSNAYYVCSFDNKPHLVLPALSSLSVTKWEQGMEENIYTYVYMRV